MKFLKGLALSSATLHSAQGPLNDSKTVYTIYFILPVVFTFSCLLRYEGAPVKYHFPAKNVGV